VNIYRTKAKRFTGSDYKEIRRKALASYNIIKGRSKRRPYVRSAYFNKEKVFLGIFWSHLYDKNYWDQTRRMKFFDCAIELIQKSRFNPVSKDNPDIPSEILHRFAGFSGNELFFVQIKEDKRSGRKSLISIFPIGK